MTEPLRADLVLSGGGVKGIALAGAAAALVQAGYLPQRISGTSAGALVGAVLAAATQAGRLSAAQLEDLATSIDYGEFRGAEEMAVEIARQYASLSSIRDVRFDEKAVSSD